MWSLADRHRLRIYPVLLAVLYLAWGSYMLLADRWALFQSHWPISITMAFGSFIAGATPAGGGAVAFPVFTKLLEIPSTDARTFGLMIQSVGMTMASIVILSRRVPIVRGVILWASIGGAVGQVLGTFWLQLPSPYPKILFSSVVATFGIALAISRWVLRGQPAPTLDLSAWGRRWRFLGVGVVGGIVVSNIGSGLDLLTFMLLTLAFGVDEKVSTPTIVIIMAMNSLVGFALRGAVGDIGIVWSYWLCAVPIVAVGAPLGAYFVSRVHRDVIIRFLLILISVEFITTLVLVRFDAAAYTVVAVSALVAAAWFTAMLRGRAYAR